MAEVITCQFGSFANFVGTHFWNLQQEQINIDDEITRRQGDNGDQTTSGLSRSVLFSEHQESHLRTTLRPRLVAFDLCASLGGSVHKADIGQSEFCQETLVIEANPVNYSYLPCHPYIRYLNGEGQDSMHANSKKRKLHRTFNFRESVKYFTDFFTAGRQITNALCLIPAYYHGIDQFESYLAGRELCTHEDAGSFWESATDKFRSQLELSNNAGVIHFLVDWQTGFGGIASGALEWFHDNSPKIPILIYGNQKQEETMSTTSLRWTAPVRRVGGGLFLQDCRNVLSTDFNAIVLSDFNILGQGSAHQLYRGQTGSSLSLGGLDFASTYESSALPGLALDLLSMPYRIEGGRTFAGRELFESISTSCSNRALMDVFLGCPAHPHLFNLKCDPHAKGVPFVQNLWDVSVSPLGQPAYQNTVLSSSSNYTAFTQFCMARGLTTDQEIQLVAQLQSRERRLCHPNPTPIPITFPQFMPSEDDMTEVSSIALMRAMNQPSRSQVLSLLAKSTERVLHMGKQEQGIEKQSLKELSEMFCDIFHSDDTAVHDEQ